MTEYPVQCYDNNGEPYGRYKNPNPRPLDDKEYLEWMKFESFDEANTFPMLGAEIGKRYDSVEVEISWQTEFGIDNWVSSDTIPDSVKNLGWYTERQIFQLAPKPVEKEPETVEQAVERLFPDDLEWSNVDRLSNAMRREGFRAAIDWQKQKEASR